MLHGYAPRPPQGQVVHGRVSAPVAVEVDGIGSGHVLVMLGSQPSGYASCATCGLTTLLHLQLISANEAHATESLRAESSDELRVGDIVVV